MGKVNRTVLHKSVPTVQTFKLGGVVREVTDVFQHQGTLYQYNGDLPHQVQAGSVPNSNWEPLGYGLLSGYYGESILGTVPNVDVLKTLTPTLGSIVRLKEYSTGSNIGGGVLVATSGNTFDNWVSFESATTGVVWVRSDCTYRTSYTGTPPMGDITPFLQYAASHSLKVVHDLKYDVVVENAIVLGGELEVHGEPNSGFIVLSSTRSDEMFRPHTLNPCKLELRYCKFKATTCLSNTPYVVGTSMYDSRTKLVHLVVKDCVLIDIGVSSDTELGVDFTSTIQDNTITISKDMTDKIIGTGRSYLRGVIRTWTYNPTTLLSNVLRSIKSSSKPVKIVIYGDSTVDGYGTSGWSANPVSSTGSALGKSNHNTNSPNSWATQLDSKLKTINPDVSVYNAGYGSRAVQDDWAITNYEAAVTNNPYYGKCDYCFIVFGLNDRSRPSWNASIYKDKYIKLIKYLRQQGTEPVVVTSDPTNRPDNAVTFEQYRDELIPLQKEIATETACAYLDVFTYMSNVPKWTTLQSDGIHFGDAGNVIKSEYILSLFKLEDASVLTANSPRKGSTLISGNTVQAHMPTLPNQDLGKFTGQINTQKILGNTFWNTNLNSSAEVDCYAGVSSSVVSGNTFKNVSTKFMSLTNSGTSEYLMTSHTSVVGNTWLMEEGCKVDYGVRFKCDVSVFTGNTIRNNQSKPTGQFLGIWIEPSRGTGGFLGSENAVGNIISANIVDVQCADYNGQYWRTLESVSTSVGTVITGNTFLGGGWRQVPAPDNIISNNTLINVNTNYDSLLRNRQDGTNLLDIVDGVSTDKRVVTKDCTVQSGKNTVTIPTPWADTDTGEWVLQVRAYGTGLENWQTFRVPSNARGQSVTQSSGRWGLNTSDAGLRSVQFVVVISSQGLVLTSRGNSTTPVKCQYKWVDAVR